MLFVLLAGLPVSLLPIQILLVNLFTDGLPAIALGMEPAGRDLMSNPPRPREEGLFAHGLTRTILLRGTLLGLASSLVYGGALWLGCDLAVARSACFLTIVFSQMVHLFECRDSGLLANPLCWGQRDAVWRPQRPASICRHCKRSAALPASPGSPCCSRRQG